MRDVDVSTKRNKKIKINTNSEHSVLKTEVCHATDVIRREKKTKPNEKQIEMKSENTRGEREMKSL